MESLQREGIPGRPGAALGPSLPRGVRHPLDLQDWGQKPLLGWPLFHGLLDTGTMIRLFS